MIQKDQLKIQSLVSELLPVVRDLVSKGNGSIALNSLVMEVTGKAPVEHEREMSAQSVHGSLILNQIGEELIIHLMSSHPHKNFRVLSSWGRSPSLVVSDK